MAKDDNNKLMLGAAGVLIAAAAATAGAVLANKTLRKQLGDKAAGALEVVSSLALSAEKQAEGGLRQLGEKAGEMMEGNKKTSKKFSKKK